MEQIKKIESFDDFKPANDGHYSNYEGFEVETTEQRIYVLISNSSSCCENWGHFATPDDPKEFIGAQLLKVEIVDEALNKETFEKDCGDVYDGGVMFVNFETDRGTFQLTAYNKHNGYYGHTAKVISRDLNTEMSL